jgi:hypothetical protein
VIRYRLNLMGSVGQASVPAESEAPRSDDQTRDSQTKNLASSSVVKDF